MDFSTDILQPIPDEELPQLSKFYEHCDVLYIHGFIETSIEWKSRAPTKKYITFYAPQGNWKIDGTFIAHIQVKESYYVGKCAGNPTWLDLLEGHANVYLFEDYDYLSFTMEESCKRLYDGFTQTKRFDFLNHRSLFYLVHRKQIPCIKKVIATLNIVVDMEHPCDVCVISKEKAKEFVVSIPQEVYLNELTRKDVPLLNSFWPHRYQNSVRILESMKEMGRGYGLFLKTDNSLVSWIIKNTKSTFGIVQTAHGHYKKGYAQCLVKYLSKEIAEDGFDPLASIFSDNDALHNMIKKLGFEMLDTCSFIESKRVEW